MEGKMCSCKVGVVWICICEICVTLLYRSWCRLVAGWREASREKGRVLSLPEPLLSCSVPDLQFDPFARLDLHQAGEEVHPHGRVRHLGEAALREPPDQTRFADRGVSDDDQTKLIKPYRLHVSPKSNLCRNKITQSHIRTCFVWPIIQNPKILSLLSYMTQKRSKSSNFRR